MVGTTKALFRNLNSRLRVPSRTVRMMCGSNHDGNLSVHITGKLTSGSSQEFMKKSLANAKESVLEAGVSRFDVLKRIELDAAAHEEFMLIEIYNDTNGPKYHKETSHYKTWRDGVAHMMAEQRVATKFRTIFPTEKHWYTASSAGSIDINTYSTGTGRMWSSSLEESFAARTSLLVVVVDIAVVAGTEDAFITASLDNCKHSVKEAGIHRFDLLQDMDDPTHFTLMEVYNSKDAPASHKDTVHYKRWTETVQHIMARPRTSAKYRTLFPEPLHWDNTVLDTHFSDSVKTHWSHISRPGLSSCAAGAETGFSFLSPKVIMGRGIASRSIKTAMIECDIRKPYLVTGSSGLSRYQNNLGESYSYLFDAPYYRVSSEPTINDAVIAVDEAKKKGCDGIIAIGGGSALDLGKAVSALYTNLGVVHDGKISNVYTFMESVGEGLYLYLSLFMTTISNPNPNPCPLSYPNKVSLLLLILYQ
jgi:(4S)-4-hydroxy-5-phosphonooxypentane-2,3-dione isomerase